MNESVAWYGFLVRSAGELAAYLWPVSLALAVAAAFAIRARRSHRDQLARLGPWSLFGMFSAPFLVLAAGTAFRYELYGPPHPHWQPTEDWFGVMLWLPVVLQVVLFVVVLFQQKHSRLSAAGVLLPALWLSFCAVFPAGF